jgi:hypothetical protein
MKERALFPSSFFSFQMYFLLYIPSVLAFQALSTTNTLLVQTSASKLPQQNNNPQKILGIYGKLVVTAVDIHALDLNDAGNLKQEVDRKLKKLKHQSL